MEPSAGVTGVGRRSGENGGTLVGVCPSVAERVPAPPNDSDTGLVADGSLDVAADVLDRGAKGAAAPYFEVSNVRLSMPDATGPMSPKATVAADEGKGGGEMDEGLGGIAGPCNPDVSRPDGRASRAPRADTSCVCPEVDTCRFALGKSSAHRILAPTGMIAPHTEQRARKLAPVTLAGSTRKTDWHSGQETFMTRQ